MQPKPPQSDSNSPKSARIAKSVGNIAAWDISFLAASKSTYVDPGQLGLFPNGLETHDSVSAV
jgi:hypothetical protein